MDWSEPHVAGVHWGREGGVCGLISTHFEHVQQNLRLSVSPILLTTQNGIHRYYVHTYTLHFRPSSTFASSMIQRTRDLNTHISLELGEVPQEGRGLAEDSWQPVKDPNSVAVATR